MQGLNWLRRPIIEKSPLRPTHPLLRAYISHSTEPTPRRRQLGIPKPQPARPRRPPSLRPAPRRSSSTTPIFPIPTRPLLHSARRGLPTGAAAPGAGRGEINQLPPQATRFVLPAVSSGAGIQHDFAGKLPATPSPAHLSNRGESRLHLPLCHTPRSSRLPSSRC